MSHPAAPVIQLPTYSVVIPNYNHGHYLESALEGHLTQRVPPREIIVVDDASTDESCTLVERASDKHSHVRLIRFQRNSGVNTAINRGLREACGDYVCVSAADDVMTPSFAAKSLELLSQYPTAGFCFSDRAQLLGDSGIVKRLPLFLSDRPCRFSPEAIARLLKINFFSFASNTILYRRDALSAIGGFNEDLRWYADWFADYVMAFRHGACYVPEVLAIYRVLPGSYSAHGVRQSETQRELIYRILDALASNPWQDVARSFRSGALMPEMSVRVLMWLLVSPRHRGYVTPRLAGRLLFGSLWSVLMPLMPDWLHQSVRWLAGAPTRWAHRSAARSGERQ
jgi:glycosyltransferase involved in cell wall biosynthesis